VNTVTVRDRRNNGGEVLRRVEHGERIVVSRDAAPMAELRPWPRSSASPAELIRRRKKLPLVNPDALRRDIDNLIDSSLTAPRRGPLTRRGDGLQLGDDSDQSTEVDTT
jgi:prevent-host-death family protein